MLVVAAPNACKGSLSAHEQCRCIARAARRVSVRIRVCARPMADGGDGTAEVLRQALGGAWRRARVRGPLGEAVEARWLWCSDRRLAVVEMACASGLALVPRGLRNPKRTTTYGTGQLIAEAAAAGAQRIVVAVGGSATTDGGAGAVQALGAEFRDARGRRIASALTGGILGRIAHAGTGALRATLRSAQLDVACDVRNPLLGPRGAPRVFGPQKGASERDVLDLEAGLASFVRVAARAAGCSPAAIARTPGAGASGGLAAGLMAFCGARLLPGAALVAELVGLDRAIAEADLVITGEGAVDAQTLMGKAPAEVARVAARHNVPVVLVGGSIQAPQRTLRRAGFAAGFSIVAGPATLEQAMENAESLLVERVESVLSVWHDAWSRNRGNSRSRA